MDKMKMHTPNLADENYKKLVALFPNAVTEVITGYDEDGKAIVERAIDKDVLMQEISAHVVEGREERYQFTWPDKKKAMLAANAPISATLRPVRADSVGKDGTPGGWDSENLYIEGDNLDVLKLLQETYLGKVKMIYIDPPYNTGKDFVYEDDFSESERDYVPNSGLYDDDGNLIDKYDPNTDANGRFHTDWLNMLYPRLKIAKNLLSNDGIIFISIDDREVDNLRNICNEIFNRNNFLAMFCWRTDGNFDNQAKVKRCHEYILAYCRDINLFPAPPTIDPNIDKNSKLFNNTIRNTIIKNGPKNPVSSIILPSGFPCDFDEGIIKPSDVNWPKYDTEIVVKNGKTINSVKATSGWASKAQLELFIKNGFNNIKDAKNQDTKFVITYTGAIEAIKERSDTQSYVISVLNGLGGSQKASLDLGELADYFEHPKPVVLIKYLISMIYGHNAIILDFFSGSATTAHAVLQKNIEDKEHRKFIMVQLPEAINQESATYKAGYKNICEIGKERLRRAGRKIKEEAGMTAQDLDIGFRVLRLDSSNMQDVYYNPSAMTQTLLDMTTDNIKPDRTPEDLLFQVMLDLGVDLSSPIQETIIDGKKVFAVAGTYLLACFDTGVTSDTVTAIAKQRPYYAVFRDSSMANDSVATNFDQIFETYSHGTVRRVL